MFSVFSLIIIDFLLPFSLLSSVNLSVKHSKCVYLSKCVSAPGTVTEKHVGVRTNPVYGQLVVRSMRESLHM